MDISSIVIDCDIDTIYHFMSTIEKINLWSMGIEWDMNTKDNIVKGVSNYDQSVSYLKIVKNNNIKRLIIGLGKKLITFLQGYMPVLLLQMIRIKIHW